MGALANSDDQGKVDVAIYVKPSIMGDGLTHQNLQSHDHTAYLFMEEGPGYKDKRLFLEKLREEKDSELLYSLRKKSTPLKKKMNKALFWSFSKSERS